MPSISRALIYGAAAVFLVGWSFSPRPFDVDPDTKRFILGTKFFMPPAMYALNFVLHPIRHWLVPLDIEKSKIRAIEKMNGYDKFGDMADWEALDEWVANCEVNCHVVGRFMMSELVPNALRFHLFMNQQLEEHPEISDEVIEKPIMIAPYTRTGGTFLYMVVAEIFNDILHASKQYEAASTPLDMENKENPLSPSPRAESVEGGLMLMNYLAPPMRFIHEYITAMDVEEDSGYYIHTFRGLANSFLLPSTSVFFRFYDESGSCYSKFITTILKIKQYYLKKQSPQQQQRPRFILKAPEHLQNMPELFRTFPDANVITIDRSETAVYTSSLIMTHHARSVWVLNPAVNDTLFFNDHLVCREHEAMQLAHNQQDGGDDGHHPVLAMSAPDIFIHTFDHVARIAQFAGLPWDEDRQERARQVITARHSWKKTKPIYKISDFGLDDAMIEERLSRCHELPRTYDEWLAKTQQQKQ